MQDRFALEQIAARTGPLPCLLSYETGAMFLRPATAQIFVSPEWEPEVMDTPAAPEMEHKLNVQPQGTPTVPTKLLEESSAPSVPEVGAMPESQLYGLTSPQDA